MFKFVLFFIVVISVRLSLFIAASHSRAGFINLTQLLCESNDNETVIFPECKLDIISENRRGIQLHIKHPNNFEDILVSGRLLRKKNSKFQPFLYDATMTFCDMLHNPQGQIFWEIGFKMMVRYSNINHSCPYDHDLIVKDFTVSGDEFKLIPFPRGNYIALVQMGYQNVFKGKIQVFFTKL